MRELLDNFEISPDQEFKGINEAAKAGNVQAQKRLAEMYEKGIGTEKNLELSKHWADIASGKKSPD